MTAADTEAESLMGKSASVEIAIQRAFDVLGREEAMGVIGHLEARPKSAIAVLEALEAIEERKPSAPSAPWPARPEPLTASAWKTMRRRKRKREQDRIDGLDRRFP